MATLSHNPGAIARQVGSRLQRNDGTWRLRQASTQTVGAPPGRSRTRVLQVSARLQIDRRRHLEEAFRRQLAEEQRRTEMAVSCPLECVREVRNLLELETELAAAEAEGELVIVDFYNSACGACKGMLANLIVLCKTGALDSCLIDLHEAESLDQVPARFLKHNVRDDYDDLTDIARLYRIKTVPTFAFFLDGSRIGQMVTRDSRKVAASLASLLVEKRGSLGKRELQ